MHCLSIYSDDLYSIVRCVSSANKTRVRTCALLKSGPLHTYVCVRAIICTLPYYYICGTTAGIKPAMGGGCDLHSGPVIFALFFLPPYTYVYSFFYMCI